MTDELLNARTMKQLVQVNRLVMAIQHHNDLSPFQIDMDNFDHLTEKHWQLLAEMGDTDFPSFGTRDLVKLQLGANIVSGVKGA